MLACGPAAKAGAGGERGMGGVGGEGGAVEIGGEVDTGSEAMAGVEEEGFGSEATRKAKIEANTYAETRVGMLLCYSSKLE